MNDSIPLKRCNGCGLEFPATKEYFWSDVQGKYGFRGRCKACESPASSARAKKRRAKPEVQHLESEQHKQRYAELKADPERYAARRQRQNERRRERRITDIEYATRQRELGRQRYALKSLNPEWMAKEHDRKMALQRAKALDPVEREKLNARQRQRRADPEFKKAEALRMRDYQQTPHGAEVFRIHAHRRDARKRLLVSDLTVEQWNATVAYFDNRCAYCGRKPDKLVQEHVIPLSKNGGYTASNIIPACWSCNSSKHDNDLEEWLIAKFGDQAEEINKRIRDYINNL